MEDNTALINAESNIAPLQLPEETTSLIKASHPEGVSAGVTGLRNMVIRSNAIRCAVSELHHHLAQGR